MLRPFDPNTVAEHRPFLLVYSLDNGESLDELYTPEEAESYGITGSGDTPVVWVHAGIFHLEAHGYGKLLYTPDGQASKLTHERAKSFGWYAYVDELARDVTLSKNEEPTLHIVHASGDSHCMWPA